MKVGNYVRFKDKRGNTYIRKIIEIPEDNRYASFYIDKEANYSDGLSPKNIIKSSPNIIDLIEVGDYVNGMKVGEKPPIINPNTYKEYIKGKIFLDDKIYTGFVESWWDRPYIETEDIKSIVTHEQFSQMEYKVGE